MTISRVFIILLPLLAGCDQGRINRLVPLDEVRIYSDTGGNVQIGSSLAPLEVIDIIYVNKDDYVVEVRYGAGRGYVKKGSFKLERDKLR